MSATEEETARERTVLVQKDMSLVHFLLPEPRGVHADVAIDSRFAALVRLRSETASQDHGSPGPSRSRYGTPS